MVDTLILKCNKGNNIYYLQGPVTKALQFASYFSSQLHETVILVTILYQHGAKVKGPDWGLNNRVQILPPQLTRYMNNWELFNLPVSKIPFSKWNITLLGDMNIKWVNTLKCNVQGKTYFRKRKGLKLDESDYMISLTWGI